MWQLCISVDKTSEKCLDYIEERTEGLFKVRDIHGDRPRLSLAYDGNDCTRQTTKIKALIADCITEQYKQKFISSYISMPTLEENRSGAFLQALVAFDRLYEHNYVLSRLEFEDYIAIDGFLNFRLKELKFRWKDVCELASLGGRYIIDSDTYMDMLSFLVSNIDPKSDSVSIALKAGKTEDDEQGEYLLTAYNSRRKPISSVLCDNKSLLAKIIELSPKFVCIAPDCSVDRSNLSILKRIYQIKE